MGPFGVSLAKKSGTLGFLTQLPILAICKFKKPCVPTQALIFVRCELIKNFWTVFLVFFGYIWGCFGLFWGKLGVNVPK